MNEAKLTDVERMMPRSPTKSLRRLSAQSQISYGSAQRAMKKFHLRAYHVRCVQELKEPDKEKRLVYFRWFRSFVDDHGIAQA